MPITNYGQYMDEFPGKGKVATIAEHRADSAAAAAAIEWGLAVQYNATNKEQVEPYDGTGSFAGVALANHYDVYRQNTLSGADPEGAYAQYDAVSVFRKGTIWVQVLEDVEKGEAAVVDDTTANFRPGGTATTTVSEAVGVFKTSAAANGYAQLEINLP